MSKEKKKVEEIAVVLKRSQPSVEIKKDNKGTFSFVVKTYADSIEDAIKEAKKATDVIDKYVKSKR